MCDDSTAPGRPTAKLLNTWLSWHINGDYSADHLRGADHLHDALLRDVAPPIVP